MSCPTSRGRSALSTLLHSRNLAADLVSGGALSVLALALFIPAARDLFHFAVPPLWVLAAAGAAALAAVLPFDLAKRTRSSRAPA